MVDNGASLDVARGWEGDFLTFFALDVAVDQYQTSSKSLVPGQYWKGRKKFGTLLEGAFSHDDSVDDVKVPRTLIRRHCRTIWVRRSQTTFFFCLGRWQIFNFKGQQEALGGR